MSKSRLGLSDSFGCAFFGTMAGISTMIVVFVVTSMLHSGLPLLSVAVMALVAAIIALPFVTAVLAIFVIAFVLLTNEFSLGARKVSAFVVLPTVCSGSGLALSFLLIGQPAFVLSMTIAGGIAGLAMAGAAVRALRYRATISSDVDGKGRRLFVPGWMGW